MLCSTISYKLSSVNRDEYLDKMENYEQEINPAFKFMQKLNTSIITDTVKSQIGIDRILNFGLDQFPEFIKIINIHYLFYTVLHYIFALLRVQCIQSSL